MTPFLQRFDNVAPKSRYTPANQDVTPFSGPRCRTFFHSQQAGGSAGWWRVSRHSWVPKTDRAAGGYRSYSHTPVALLCATKNQIENEQPLIIYLPCFNHRNLLDQKKPHVQQLHFGVFREGVVQKMPALEGQFLKEIL